MATTAATINRELSEEIVTLFFQSIYYPKELIQLIMSFSIPQPLSSLNSIQTISGCQAASFVLQTGQLCYVSKNGHVYITPSKITTDYKSLISIPMNVHIYVPLLDFIPIFLDGRYWFYILIPRNIYNTQKLNRNKIRLLNEQGKCILKFTHFIQRPRSIGMDEKKQQFFIVDEKRVFFYPLLQNKCTSSYYHCMYLPKYQPCHYLCYENGNEIKITENGNIYGWQKEITNMGKTYADTLYAIGRFINHLVYYKDHLIAADDNSSAQLHAFTLEGDKCFLRNVWRTTQGVYGHVCILKIAAHSVSSKIAILHDDGKLVVYNFI